MKNQNTLLVIAASALALLTACPPGDGHTHRKIMYPIPLGSDINNFYLDKVYYAGPRVARFKLHFRIVQPKGKVGWNDQTTVRLLRTNGTLLQELTADPNNGEAVRESDFVEGNTCRIVVSSNGLRRVEPGTRLEITEVVLDFLDDSEPTPAPFRITQGQEIIVLCPENGGGRQDFRFTAPDGSHARGVYISPCNVSLYNQVGLAAAIGLGSPSTLFMQPAGTDTGIYTEMAVPPAGDMYITVTTEYPTHYALTVQPLMQLHDVVIEMDGSLTSGESVFDRRSYEESAGNMESWAFNPNFRQVADYVSRRADFPRRMHEVVVIAAARALAATEGFMRFDDVDIYHSVDPFRNVDYHMKDECGRAYRGRYFVQMYINSLYNPVDGGDTFMHEFGHWDYGMPDEYADLGGTPYSEPIDWNTIMGYGGAYEFCSLGNHLWSPHIPRPGSNSNWWLLNARYHVLPPGPSFYPQNTANYMDVLCRLEQILDVVHHPNANPSPPVSRTPCPE